MPPSPRIQTIVEPFVQKFVEDLTQAIRNDLLQEFSRRLNIIEGPSRPREPRRKPVYRRGRNRRTPEAQRVLDTLRSAKQPLVIEALALKLDLAVATVRYHLKRLKDEIEVGRESRHKTYTVR